VSFLAACAVSLAEKIAKPAEAAELEIWRELLSGQRMGARAGVVSLTASMHLSRTN